MMILTSGLLLCQDENVRTIDGRVLSVDAQGSTVVVKSVETLAFSVPSDATIINSEGYDMELSSVSPGNYVMIDYYDDRSGRHIIKNMEVEYNR